MASAELWLAASQASEGQVLRKQWPQQEALIVETCPQRTAELLVLSEQHVAEQSVTCVGDAAAVMARRRSEKLNPSALSSALSIWTALVQSSQQVSQTALLSLETDLESRRASELDTRDVRRETIASQETPLDETAVTTSETELLDEQLVASMTPEQLEQALAKDRPASLVQSQAICRLVSQEALEYRLDESHAIPTQELEVDEASAHILVSEQSQSEETSSQLVAREQELLEMIDVRKKSASSVNRYTACALQHGAFHTVHFTRHGKVRKVTEE